jgi:DNA-binding MarR family transcriptional regulator
MGSTAETTAQQLGKSLMEFNKAFMLFNRAELHQNFAGCKRSEIGVLFMIRNAAKPEGQSMKVSEISKMMHVTSPTVTQLLKGLEANGLIERHLDPNDRRAVGIALTRRGEEIAQKAEKIFLSSFNGLAEYLGEEESTQLTELLRKAFRYFNTERETSLYHFQWNGEEEA